MTTDDDGVDMEEASRDQHQHGGPGQDEDLDPPIPLESLREVMQAVLTNLQQNTRAIRAVGSAVGDLGELLNGHSTEDETTTHHHSAFCGREAENRGQKGATEALPPVGGLTPSTLEHREEDLRRGREFLAPTVDEGELLRPGTAFKIYSRSLEPVRISTAGDTIFLRRTKHGNG